MALIFLSLGWLVGLYLGQTAGADSTHSVGHCPSSRLERGSEDWRLWRYLLLSRQSGSSVVDYCPGGSSRAARSLEGLSLLPDEDLLIAKPGPVLVRGTIATQPEPRDAAMLLVLDVDARRSQEGWEVVRSRLLVRTDRYDSWSMEIEW